MSAFLLPLAAALLGDAVLRIAGARCPPAERAGTALILGPPLLSLLFYLCLLSGIPHGAPLAVFLCALGPLLFVLAPRRPPPAPGPALSRLLPVIVVAAAATALVILRILAHPTPDGDGLFNFALKARGIHALGSIQDLLRHERMAIVHGDYPLHVPLSMDLGFLLGGGVDGLRSLVFTLPLLPGLILLVGGRAARHSSLLGVLGAGLVGFLPLLHATLTSGYADPHLMGVFTVAALGCSLTVHGDRSAGVTAGLATGLLPWIKLEGLVLGIILGFALLSAMVRRRRRPTGFFLPALVLGAVWPLTLLLAGLAGPMAEPTGNVGLAERAHAAAQGFGTALLSPEGPLAMVWVPVLLACMPAAFGTRATLPRTLARITLAALLALPMLAVLRHTATQHLLLGDVPARLAMQVLPAGLLALLPHPGSSDSAH